MLCVPSNGQTRGTIQFVVYSHISNNISGYSATVLQNAVSIQIKVEKVDGCEENGQNRELNLLPPEILWVHIVNPSSAEWTARMLNGPLATGQMCDTFTAGVQHTIYYTDYEYVYNKFCYKVVLGLYGTSSRYSIFNAPNVKCNIFSE